MSISFNSNFSFFYIPVSNSLMWKYEENIKKMISRPIYASRRCIPCVEFLQRRVEYLRRDHSDRQYNRHIADGDRKQQDHQRQLPPPVQSRSTHQTPPSRLHDPDAALDIPSELQGIFPSFLQSFKASFLLPFRASRHLSQDVLDSHSFRRLIYTGLIFPSFLQSFTAYFLAFCIPLTQI